MVTPLLVGIQKEAKTGTNHFYFEKSHDMDPFVDFSYQGRDVVPPQKKASRPEEKSNAAESLVRYFSVNVQPKPRIAICSTVVISVL